MMLGATTTNSHFECHLLRNYLTQNSLQPNSLICVLLCDRYRGPCFHQIALQSSNIWKYSKLWNTNILNLETLNSGFRSCDFLGSYLLFWVFLKLDIYKLRNVVERSVFVICSATQGLICCFSNRKVRINISKTLNFGFINMIFWYGVEQVSVEHMVFLEPVVEQMLFLEIVAVSGRILGG